MSDKLGENLSALADRSPPLDEAARERIIAFAVVSGPKIVRGARRRRIAIRIAGVVAAIGVVFAVAMPWPSSPAAPRCEAWGPVAEASLGEAHTMGGRGTVTTEVGTVARIRGEGACRTHIDLDEGHVTVRADDLGGGSLQVRTARGDVVVHGTVFSVEARDDVVRIAVDEGRVSWNAKGKSAVYLGATESLVVEADEISPVTMVEPPIDSPRRPTRTAVEGAHRKSKRTVAPTTESRAATSQTLVLRAEAFRRGGNYASARSTYRAAGKFEDGTGEAAWVALARLELELGQPRAALDALREHQSRFPRGTLELESEWIAVRALSKAGEHARARQRAKQITRRWPDSAQAQAASAWLERAP